MVALAIPALLVTGELRRGVPFHPAGLPLLVAGLFLLLWCVRMFYVSGLGTLAPWSPPRSLVTAGPYRFSRNPMYIAVTLMLAGWSIAGMSGIVTIYMVFVIVAFQFRVVFGEEPWLARTHGAAWEEYKSRVPRWLL